MRSPSTSRCSHALIKSQKQNRIPGRAGNKSKYEGLRHERISRRVDDATRLLMDPGRANALCFPTFMVFQPFSRLEILLVHTFDGSDCAARSMRNKLIGFQSDFTFLCFFLKGTAGVKLTHELRRLLLPILRIDFCLTLIPKFVCTMLKLPRRLRKGLRGSSCGGDCVPSPRLTPKANPAPN